MLKFRMLKRAVFAVALLTAVGCDIGFGGPAPFNLGVQWIPQQTSYWCVPAAIQMWALYDGYSFAQSAIASFVGAVAPAGTPAANVVTGVVRFTAEKDAVPYVAFGGGPDYYSKQVTSINNGIPFLAIFNAQHVVTVGGGQWHTDDTTGLYVWDLVVFQDPIAGGPNSSADAGDWIALNDAMVISASASSESLTYLNEYGGNVGVRGSNYRLIQY